MDPRSVVIVAMAALGFATVCVCCMHRCCCSCVRVKYVEKKESELPA